MTTTLAEFVQILGEISKIPENCQSLIKQFQNLIWEEKDLRVSTEELTILKDLAYDLDFFEPNLEIRREDGSFFDEGKLKAEIIKGLKKLKGNC